MIYVGIGANLDHPHYGGPRETCGAALYSLDKDKIHILGCSSWYQSAPVPKSDQPDYINAVISIETALEPHDLLKCLLDLELEFGRTRNAKNAARTLDLDLLDYHGQIMVSENGLDLPHPRLVNRAFVLLPLAELDQNWRHPVSGQVISTLISQLPREQPGDQQAVALKKGIGVFGTAWNPENLEIT